MSFIIDVLELDVFTEEGEHIVKFDSLTRSKLFYNPDGRSYLGVTDALFRKEMLEHIGSVTDKEPKSDFSKFTDGDKEETVIKFFHQQSKPRFKLVAKGLSYDPETNKIDNEITVIVPLSKLNSGYAIESDLATGKASSFDFIFNFITDDVNAELFEVRIKEVK